MITTLLLAATIFQTPATPTGTAQDTPKPGDLISKMLAKYASANTIVADITLTAQDMAGSVSLTTNVQLDRKASHLYIRQNKLAGNKQQWLTIIDGKHYAYDLAEDVVGWQPGKRFEEVMGPETPTKTYQDAYAVAAAGLGDRSAPLDIIVSRQTDLKYLIVRWVSIKYSGRAKISDQDVNVITGKLTMAQGGQTSGEFEMDLNDNNELVRYVVKQKMDIPGRGPQPVAMTWICKIDTSTPPDPSVFVIKN